MLLKFLSKYRDGALLFLRIGLGVCFVLHGMGKFMGGSGVLAAVGKAAGVAGLPGSAHLWGIIAASTEAVGGLLLIIGLVYRPVCLVLAIMMVMATTHLYVNERKRSFRDFPVVSHPLKMAIVFVGLAFIGPGRFSIDKD